MLERAKVGRGNCMVAAAVEVANFRKVYGDFVAVDGISFEVQPGQIFGLLGPNGAGKTSTLESLEGLRPPTGGTLRVVGINPTKEPRKLRGVIGVQLQAAGLPETITPTEAMRIFCAYHGIAPRNDLLDRLGLTDKADTQYVELSGGQQRRLELALAIAHDPQVLFLDEPTAGLDVPSRAELHRLIRELRASGTTIILATHDMAEAEEMADQVAILLSGEIAAIGTPRDITSRGAELTKVSVRTANGSLVSSGLAFPAVERQYQEEEYSIYLSADIGPTVSAIIAYVDANGDHLIDLRVERPSLEDRFLEIAISGGGS
ncbi:MAG: ABC transporter ATP-binding protein [Acidimicrobiia bacterium]|nr:ABC transporter ATP-binding protein [Acidimicrobiia bacterium]